ncbi:hypothetical protein BpHYR1_026162 [Brachionus plicatilis]|uniref:Uncharacterized protein n=1 Tax=Brachionus plicatilis TaxID=10195 RepID=A0A3M7T765_BRAPC|nr:hypothetical protein BpHYR1_026162 [Brachionus plicatilis]
MHMDPGHRPWNFPFNRIKQYKTHTKKSVPYSDFFVRSAKFGYISALEYDQEFKLNIPNELLFCLCVLKFRMPILNKILRAKRRKLRNLILTN